MALQHAILGFLDAGPMTGYDLKTRCFDEAAGHVWTADQAQVYRTLDRLQTDGLVNSKIVAQRGKPDRRLYSITSRGRRALGDWVASPEDPSAPRDAFLMHLFFSAELPDAELVSLLAHARSVYQARLDDLRVSGLERIEEFESASGRLRDAALRRMTLTAGMAQARTAIDWIDDCLDRISSGLPIDSPQSADSEGEPS